MPSWTAAELPDQTGRTFVVTGANGGLGEATARELAAHGARVVLACRNAAKASAAAGRMTGDVHVEALDLADLASVRSFAERCEPLAVLINNAGVMAVPKRRSADGFELQFATNFLGHFALTGLLLPKVSGRVVTLSSFVHHFGHIDLADLNWHQRRYRRWPAYAQSKLADLMFAFELQRRLTLTRSLVLSVAAHPGYASTELQSHTESLQGAVLGLGNRILAQSATAGAWPVLYAATMPGVAGGDFWGPDRFGGLRGSPRRSASSRAARDRAVAAKLWSTSEALTGVTFDCATPRSS